MATRLPNGKYRVYLRRRGISPVQGTFDTEKAAQAFATLGMKVESITGTCSSPTRFRVGMQRTLTQRHFTNASGAPSGHFFGAAVVGRKLLAIGILKPRRHDHKRASG